MRWAMALMAIAALAGCKRGGYDQADATATDVPKAVSATPIGISTVESRFGTPVKDRVVTLGLLNKRNNEEQDLVMKSGEARRVGNVVVRVATCERTLPWETPPEVGAFVQVFVEERANTNEKRTWHKVFSGWLFKNSPSLNVVEHPVYDVWVKACAMKFPGEEETPSASASTAAKPAGKPGAPVAKPSAPAAKPTAPAPQPAASPAPAAEPTSE